jgi:hypothetical protein
MDQTINITLTRRQWQFAIEQVRNSIPIVASIDDQDSLVILQGAGAVVTPERRWRLRRLPFDEPHVTKV